MAKGGYNKKRLEKRKALERAQRKRKRQQRRWVTGGIIAVVVFLMVFGLIPRGGGRWGISFLARDAFWGGKPSSSVNPTATPTPQQSLGFPTPCTSNPKKGQKIFQNPPCKVIDTDKTYTATFETSMGTIVVELLDDAAPVTVNNFVFLARNGFYNGSLFHRVIPDFGGPNSDMIQGGDAVKRDGTGDPGYEFGDENMIPFTQPGFLAMANRGPATNGSQFFFLNGTVSHLNQQGSCPGSGCHPVFGKVVSGLEVVSKIADVKTGAQNRPETDVVLTSVTITEK